MDSPFMDGVARELAGLGLATHRFEFPYMAQRRSDGVRRPPPKAETLLAFFRQTVEVWTARRPKGARLLIGGKSLGGRVASMVASDLHREREIEGLICLGYPFHPPGAPTKLRTAHLADLTCPALIVQGTNDTFGTRDEIETYKLSPVIKFHWVEGGNHDLAPPSRSGRTKADELKSACAAVAAFASRVS